MSRHRDGERADLPQGINLRDHPGVSLGETVELRHPQYPLQLHSMWVYRSESDGQTVIYAIDELSAGVYGFYVAD
jgi:hypothetical protein